jgi:hypothetical protein
MRLALIGLLARQASSQQVEDVRRGLADCPDLGPLDYVVKRFGLSATPAAGGGDSGSTASSLVSKGWSTLMQGGGRVASLLANYATEGDDELLKLSAVVSVLMSNTASTDSADPCRSYLYFDPKVGAQHQAAPPRRTTPFEDALVFVVGGGNYTEYQNICGHARSQGRRVIYGSTEIITPSDFLKQLAKLATPADTAKK